MEATIDCTAWASLINGETYIGGPKKLEAIWNLLMDKIYQKDHFVARVTSHIPDKGQVMVRYYSLCKALHKPYFVVIALDVLSVISSFWYVRGMEIVENCEDLWLLQKRSTYKS